MGESQRAGLSTTHQKINRRVAKCLAIGLIGVMVQVAILLLAIQQDTSNAQSPTGIIVQNLPTRAEQNVFFNTVVTFTAEVTDTVNLAHFVRPPDGVTLTVPSGWTLNSSLEPGGFIGADKNEILVFPGEIISSTFGWEIGQTGTYTFTSYVSGAFTFDSATQAIQVNPYQPPPQEEIGLTLTNDVTPTLIQGGQLLTYTLALTNTTSLPLTNVMITDTMPTGITLIDSTPSQGSCTAVDDFVSCSAETLAASGLYTLTLLGVAAPDVSGPLANTAFFTDGFDLNASGVVTVTVTVPDIDGSGTNDNDEPYIDYVQIISGTAKGPWLGYVGTVGVSLDLDSRQLTAEERSQADIASGSQIITMTIGLSETSNITSTVDVQIVPPSRQIYLPLILRSSGGGSTPQANGLSMARANGEATTQANAYLKFGSTPDNPTPHFYLFNFDGETGVVSIENGVMTLRLVDGKRGDDDLTVNGVIVDPGAPVFVPSEARMSVGANTPADASISRGTTNVPMLQFTAGAPNMATRVESVMIGTSGTGDDANDITAVKVYLDADGDGQVGAGDTQLASNTFSADDGNVILALNPAQDIAAGNSTSFLVTYDFNTTLTAAVDPTGSRLLQVATTTGLKASLAAGSPGPLALVPLTLAIPLLVVGGRRRRIRRLVLIVLLLGAFLVGLYGCDDDNGGGQIRTFTATLNGATATAGVGGSASAVTGVPVTGATVSVQ